MHKNVIEFWTRNNTSLTVFVSYSQVAQVSDLSPQQIEPAFQGILKNKNKLDASWRDSVNSKRRKEVKRKSKGGRPKQEHKDIARTAP